MKIDDAERKKNSPLVTVLIPTYNRPYFLSMAIESVLAQTYTNIEIFISDNSPNEDTKNMMQQYLLKYPNIKYEHHPEYDFFANWNRVQEYNNPKAEYINYLMDDDMFMPTKIEKMVAAMEQCPNASIVTSYRMRIDEDNNVLPDDEANEKIYQENSEIAGEKVGKALLMYMANFVGEPTTVLIRKSAFGDCKLGWTGNERRFLVTDYPAWLKLLEKGNMVYLIEALSCFRKHKDQDTHSSRFIMSVPVCYAMEINEAWNKKIFITEKKEIENCILRCIQSSLTAIEQLEIVNSDAYQHDYQILKKLIKIMGDALLNGYNIDLSWLDTTIEKR